MINYKQVMLLLLEYFLTLHLLLNYVGMLQSELELTKQNEQKEIEYRQEILQYKKDNSLLFMRYNELKDSHLANLDLVEQLEEKIVRNQEVIKELRQESVLDNEEYVTNTNHLHDRIQSLEENIQQLESELSSAKAVQAGLEESMYKLQDDNRVLESTNIQQSKTINKLNFELSNLQEDADNLYTQQESMVEQQTMLADAIVEKDSEVCICY